MLPSESDSDGQVSVPMLQSQHLSSKGYVPECRDDRVWSLFKMSTNPTVYGIEHEKIGHFRVIAGMGPVPEKVRSKRYKEITAEDFADYLGGPILYSTFKSYPNLIKASSIDEIRDDFLYGKIINSTIRLCGDPLSPIWIGVVDVELEEEPLEYHDLDEGDWGVYQPPLADDGRQYFDVDCGKLSMDVGPHGDNKGFVVGNVACGRWYFKIIDILKRPTLVAWHESVDNEPEFHDPDSPDHEFQPIVNRPRLRVRLYTEQMYMRGLYRNIVIGCLESVDVPLDMAEGILDFAIAHHNSAYWVDTELPGGWLLHRRRVEQAGFIGTERPTRRYLDIPEDVLVHVYWSDEWYHGELYAWEEAQQFAMIKPICIPGGCYFDMEDGIHGLTSFKHKGGVIHAARVDWSKRVRPVLRLRMLDAAQGGGMVALWQ